MENCALIIAVETSEDSFGAFKTIGSLSAITRMILTFKNAGIHRVYIVAEDEELVKKEVSRLGATFLPAPENSHKIMDYVKAGLNLLGDEDKKILITPASVPLFTEETVSALLKSTEDFAVPTFNGSAGHPIFIAARVIPYITEYTGKSGLVDALKEMGITPLLVPVSDSGIIVTSPKDSLFETALEEHNLQKIAPEIAVRITREIPFFGPGIRQLVELTESTGSLRKACQRMGLSYSKGRRMISDAESQLGFALLERRQGGKAGGSSSLTAKGKEFLDKYVAFDEEIQQISREVFQKYFSYLDNDKQKG